MTLTPLPTVISFQEPNIQHQHDAITDPELAKKLEKKYHILRLFAQRKKDAIKKIIVKGMIRSWKGSSVKGLIKKYDDLIASASKDDQDHTYGIMGAQITALYRNFMLANGTGIKTRASIREKRQSFIATGEYYEKMRTVVR